MFRSSWGRRTGFGRDRKTGVFRGERVFRGLAPIKYLLRRSATRSRTLIVMFSGADEGKPPRYNWYRLTADVPCHRLSVLDDGGQADPPRPSWYLGAHESGFADAVCALIRRTAEDLRVDSSQLITAGTSMGGWAALYYAARVGAGHAIVGEPQALLGDFLCWEAFEDIAKHVAGGSSAAHQETLNDLLLAALRALRALRTCTSPVAAEPNTRGSRSRH